VRVIHLLRKPISESGVPANVIRHGTAALHIDACRTEVPGLTPGGPGVVRPSMLGRYPTNLILSHREGCCYEGTKRIRGAGVAVNRNKDKKHFQMVGWGFRNIVADRGYADSDGMEEMESWRCEARCAVADLDSGDEGEVSRFFRRVGGRR